MAPNLSQNREKAPAPPCGWKVLILSENLINAHPATTPATKKAGRDSRLSIQATTFWISHDEANPFTDLYPAPEIRCL